MINIKEDKNFFVFTHHKEHGCPAFIDGVLHEYYAGGIYNESMLQPWHYVKFGEQLATLPSKLFLVTKDKEYAFDIKSGFRGYLVSARFFEFLSGYGDLAKWESSILTIVSEIGDIISDGEYYFIRQLWENRLKGAIDKSESIVECDEYGDIDNIISLKISNDVNKDFFCIQDVGVGGFVFCSDLLMNKRKPFEFKGFTLVNTKNWESINGV